MIIVGAGRCIEIVNREAENLFGYQRDELIGQRFDILIPDRFQDSHSEKFEELLSVSEHPEVNSELSFVGLHKLGHEIPVNIGLSSIKSGTRNFVSATFKVTSFS